ncbi:uncharacterized protein RCC_00138 [Ramularia collo-cygni]|uniref:SRR1-like domain-containing protein n=1 Tax=Ramularia collo-cygni TaxID=112498 RepID=A0A2D3UNR9_9PEZI|nr:uncharacterized protein RCC_00138 [Ramularia collo-cygni]CZT14165.1 uncharacterized protein RCC_00138 [Ramularia collo-cygni]
MQQEDVWTHIPSKSKRHRKPALISTTNLPLKDLTLSKLSAEFHTKLKTWQHSSCRQTALRLLSRIRPEKGWNLHKAICLGSGSLSRENWECRRRSVWQFVVFYDLARHLLGTEHDCTLYAQEPAFTELDGKFLATLGISVLESQVGIVGMGAAGSELGGETFLFEPFVDMDSGMLEAMLKGGVGLYMGSSIGGILERREGSEVGRLSKEFCRGREMLKFPMFEIEPNVLDGMRIYWREESDEDDDEGAV